MLFPSTNICVLPFHFIFLHSLSLFSLSPIIVEFKDLVNIFLLNEFLFKDWNSAFLREIERHFWGFKTPHLRLIDQKFFKIEARTGSRRWHKSSDLTQKQQNKNENRFHASNSFLSNDKVSSNSSHENCYAIQNGWHSHHHYVIHKFPLFTATTSSLLSAADSTQVSKVSSP